MEPTEKNLATQTSEIPSDETGAAAGSGSAVPSSPSQVTAAAPPPPPASPPPGDTPLPDYEEVLDATVPDPTVAAPSLSPVPTKRYDPDEFRDEARKRITYWLLFLLTLLFVGAFASLFLIDGKPTFDHLKALLEILLGPLVALVSAATGFYFGAQSSSRNTNSSNG